jgi:tetratricopeptide (TPR) repeat protein
MSEARARLGAAQAELVRALCAGGAAPAGFDASALETAAETLVHKRSRAAIKLVPELAPHEKELARFAATNPVEDPLALAIAFAPASLRPAVRLAEWRAGRRRVFVARFALAHARVAGPPADVFALGAILYECLAGLPAFAGENVVAVLTRAESGSVGPLRRARPEVPAWLATVIERALSREPSRRFADGHAFLRALEGRSRAAGSRALLVAACGVLLGLLAWAAAAAPGTKRTASVASVTTRGETGPGETVRLPATAAEYAARAVARQHAGDLERAISDYDRAIELDPRSAEPFVNRGTAREAKRDFQGAISDYERAIELVPRLAVAFVNRGHARLLMGDLDGALADQDRAIDLDPRNPTSYDNRGNVRRERGDLDGAIADFDHAVELDPRAGYALQDRALVRQARGDIDGALSDYDRAIELGFCSGSAFYNRATARDARGDMEGALSDYDRAIERGFTKAFDNRGSLREARGDHDGAIADYDRAIEAHPRDALAFMNRGVARLRKGAVDEALSDFDRAIELDPRLVQAYKNRGVARRTRGNLAGTAEDFARAVALDPNDREAPNMRAFLEKQAREPKSP